MCAGPSEKLLRAGGGAAQRSDETRQTRGGERAATRRCLRAAGFPGGGGEDPHAGFTLIELSIVLVIITLVLSGMMMSLSGLKENADRAETEKSLEEIREALIGFVITTGRLPCPANPNETGGGAEDATVPGVGQETCNREVGILPWTALNVKPNDAWGRRYTYHVAARDTGVAAWSDGINLVPKTVTIGTETCTDNPSSASVALCTLGNLTIRDDVAVGGTDLSTQAVAVVVAHGRDGAGAFQSGTRIAVSTSANQAANTDALNNDGTVAGSPPNRIYVDRDFSGVVGSEFDDQVLWLSPNLIKNKLMEAKKLP